MWLVNHLYRSLLKSEDLEYTEDKLISGFSEEQTPELDEENR